MRSLAGSAALAVVLLCSPLSAQEGAEQPAAAATQPLDVPAQGHKEAVAVGSDAVTPRRPRPPSWHLRLRPRR